MDQRQLKQLLSVGTDFMRVASARAGNVRDDARALQNLASKDGQMERVLNGNHSFCHDNFPGLELKMQDQMLYCISRKEGCMIEIVLCNCDNDPVRLATGCEKYRNLKTMAGILKPVLANPEVDLPHGKKLPRLEAR